MEKRVLKAFVCVAEELNFRKAAERLHISQPPLTRLIHQLENDLGVKLFIRTTRSVELTGAGIHLFDRAKEMLKQLELLENEMKSLARLRKKILNISISPGALHSNLPRLLTSFKTEFPQIETRLVDVRPDKIESRLQSGEVDIAFGPYDFKNMGLTHFGVQSHELGVLISKTHSLSKKKTLKLEDLRGQTLIFHPKKESLGFQSDFYEYLKHKGVHCKIYYKSPNEGCSTLALEGKGILLTSAHYIHPSLHNCFIPFGDFHKRLKINGIWDRYNDSLSLKIFTSFLKENTSTPSTPMDEHLF